MKKYMYFSRVLFLVSSMLVLNAHSLIGQEVLPDEDPFVPQLNLNQRSLGDQSLAITVGIFIPLFTILLDDFPNTSYKAGTYPPNMYAGGAGSLTYSIYLSPNWKIGLQVSGSFSQDINENFTYMVPISLKGSYEFHPWGRVTIPIFLNAGISLTSWKDDNFLVDIYLRPGVGIYFDWSYEWSFGLDVGYVFVPQLGSENANERSIGNFMDITLTAEYHF